LASTGNTAESLRLGGHPAVRASLVVVPSGLLTAERLPARFGGLSESLAGRRLSRAIVWRGSRPSGGICSSRGFAGRLHPGPQQLLLFPPVSEALRADSRPQRTHPDAPVEEAGRERGRRQFPRQQPIDMLLGCPRVGECTLDPQSNGHLDPCHAAFDDGWHGVRSGSEPSQPGTGPGQVAWGLDAATPIETWLGLATA